MISPTPPPASLNLSPPSPPLLAIGSPGYQGVGFHGGEAGDLVSQTVEEDGQARGQLVLQVVAQAAQNLTPGKMSRTLVENPSRIQVEMRPKHSRLSPRVPCARETCGGRAA